MQTAKLHLTIGLILMFLFVSALGLGFGMLVDESGSMSCTFMWISSICTMNGLDHISSWQSMLTTTAPQKAFVEGLLFSLAAIFVVVALLKYNLFLLLNYCTTRWRLYIRQNPSLSFFNHLQEAFSQGILNPKIY